MWGGMVSLLFTPDSKFVSLGIELGRYFDTWEWTMPITEAVELAQAFGADREALIGAFNSNRIVLMLLDHATLLVRQHVSPAVWDSCRWLWYLVVHEEMECLFHCVSDNGAVLIRQDRLFNIYQSVFRQLAEMFYQTMADCTNLSNPGSVNAFRLWWFHYRRNYEFGRDWHEFFLSFYD